MSVLYNCITYFLYFCQDTVLSHGAKKRAKQSGGSIPQPKTSERETKAKKKEEPYKNAPRLGLSVGRLRLEGREREGRGASLLACHVVMIAF